MEVGLATPDKNKCPLSVLTGFRIMRVNFRENDAAGLNARKDRIYAN